MERVVVTGVGLVSPLGIETAETWNSAIQGKSGVGPITLFEITDEYPTRIAAEVKGFEPTAYIEKKKRKEVSRFIPFAMGASPCEDNPGGRRGRHSAGSGARAKGGRRRCRSRGE